MPVVEIAARGHENVRAAHGSTLELTSDDWLTPAGDCILAVEADTVPADIPRPFVQRCRTANTRIELELAAAGHRTVVAGRGDPDLTFASDRSLVCRTSDHVDGRTVLIGADAAAADLDRDLVSALAGGARLDATLRIE